MALIVVVNSNTEIPVGGTDSKRGMNAAQIVRLHEEDVLTKVSP